MIVLDSSIWFTYFSDNLAKVRGLIDSDIEVSCSVITLFEIKRLFLKQGLMRQKMEKYLSFIRTRSIIVDVKKHVADRAAELSFVHDLSTADAIIYATAQERSAELWTRYSDFEGLKGVVIVQ